MTNMRKEMMLYLEIKAACQPGDHLITRGKIRRAPYFMDSPFSLYDLMLFRNRLKDSLFYDMRQLEYDGQDESHHDMNDQKTREPGLPAYKIDGQQRIKEDIQDLTAPKDHMLFSADPFDRSGMYLF